MHCDIVMYALRNGYFDDDFNYYWKVEGRRRKLNVPAGTIDGFGYRKICLKNERVKAHRLSYAYYHNIPLNEVPKMLDHIDGNKLNNHPSNLRATDYKRNRKNQHGVQSNNTSGITGVGWNTKEKYWKASVKLCGGYFDAKESAEEASKKMQKRYSLPTTGSVSWDKKRSKWVVQCSIPMKITRDFFEACCMRKAAEIKYGFNEYSH